MNMMNTDLTILKYTGRIDAPLRLAVVAGCVQQCGSSPLSWQLMTIEQSVDPARTYRMMIIPTTVVRQRSFVGMAAVNDRLIPRKTHHRRQLQVAAWT